MNHFQLQKHNYLFRSLLLLLVIDALMCRIAWAASPPPLYLNETLFVSEKKDVSRDHDSDGLKDDLEFKLADHFKPFLIFDSDESARRSYEPRVLFQVRPEGCIGVGCAQTYRVIIQYAFLWARDGGYGESSDCVDAHHGDNQGAAVQVESDDGFAWKIVSVHNSHFDWPGHSVQWHQVDHATIYMSAHKHHQYFDTAYDEDDSDYTDWGCNDDVNGKGAKILPTLISPYSDKRPNNVGEPELHVSKCLKKDTVFVKGKEVEKCVKWSGNSPNANKYFIGALDSFGYPGEDAWSGKPFCGGLGCDSDETSPMNQMWHHDQFHFTNKLNWDYYDTLGGLKGKVTDSSGKPVPGLRLYFKPFHPLGLVFGCCQGPWSILPVDAAGNYEVRVPLATYLIRPAASDYDFLQVPKFVEAKQGAYTVANFTGKKTPAGIHRASLLSVTPRETTGEPTSPKLVASAVAIPEAFRSAILNVTTPDQMVAVYSKAQDGNKTVLDPFIKLPRSFTVSLHVESLLDASGNPAKSANQVANQIPKITLDQFGQKHMSPDALWTGGGVQGARIAVRLTPGTNWIKPAQDGWMEVITNVNGNAYLKLRTGAHPGWTSLEIKLTENPKNPWAVFSYEHRIIEIQPAINGDDAVTQPALSLAPIQVREQSVPFAWWRGARRTTSTDLTESSASAVRSKRLPGDANIDRVVDQKDLELVHKVLGTKAGDPKFEPVTDLNDDGVVDGTDEAIVRQNMGRRAMQTRMIKAGKN